MLLMVWVTFLYAPGLPICFPIGLFGLIIAYVTNRIKLAYCARKPPAYDNKMNATTINML